MLFANGVVLVSLLFSKKNGAGANRTSNVNVFIFNQSVLDILACVVTFFKMVILKPFLVTGTTRVQRYRLTKLQ